MTTTVHDIAQLGTILGVWAHPDDETWCMGGLLAQASINGQRTVCVTATCGEAGMTSDESKWPQADLSKIRKEELEKSLQILGVTDHKWLDCNDGQMSSADSNHYISCIKEIIEEIRPDSIFTFSADGLTGHTDHIAIRNWTTEALAESSSSAKLYSVAQLKEHFNSAIFTSTNNKFHIFMNGEMPRLIDNNQAAILYRLTDETKDMKFRALRAHESQLERFMNDTDGYKFVLSLCETEAYMLEEV